MAPDLRATILLAVSALVLPCCAPSEPAGAPLAANTYKTSLPGAPDGEYVVIAYETSFDKKQAATETITPMKDADGRWRVSGYFIK
jgi:hypothetical protein